MENSENLFQEIYGLQNQLASKIEKFNSKRTPPSKEERLPESNDGNSETLEEIVYDKLDKLMSNIVLKMHLLHKVYLFDETNSLNQLLALRCQLLTTSRLEDVL